MNTSKSIGLLALLAALFAFAVGAGGAGATIVVPPATAVQMKSTETLFLPTNAYSEFWVRCTESVAKFKTPEGRKKGGAARVVNDENVNRPAIGTHSGGNGGVWMDLSEPPTFSGCNLIHEGTVVEAATVKTNATNGAWSLTGMGVTEPAGTGAIGVPKAGATIATAGTTLTVSPEEATAVFAPEYKNSTRTLTVDSQIRFSPTINPTFLSPAQFEAKYVVSNEVPLEILP